MAQNVEAIAVCIYRKMGEIAKANAKREGRVNLNNLTERADDGHPKDRVNLDGPDNWASNECPEMRSTKVPTRSGHGFSVETPSTKTSQAGTIFPLQWRGGWECQHGR